MQGFYMVHQYRGLLDSPELADFREAITENLPEGQSFTDFSFYGPGSAVAVVHVLEQIGPDLTREKFIEAMENLQNFDTGVLAGTMSFSPDDHQGVSDVNVIGYDENGELSVFSAWGEKAK
jgi:branched-chain amino acid transport system substrate-binding protein